MNSSEVHAEYRFGGNVLLPGEQRLLIDGEPASVGPRAFELLVALAQRAGRLVSKSDLLDLVWPDVVVEENNLQVQISALRKILGAGAVETIPGRGYRFTLPVETLDGKPIAAGTTRRADSTAPQIGTGPVLMKSGSTLPERLPPLFGRDRDVAALQELTARHALVTIVGPGGIGKTRLAAAVSFGQRDKYADGIAWIELAPLSDPSVIPGTIAAAVGVQLIASLGPPDALARALVHRSLLIILDNGEHLVAALADVADALVKQTRNVRLLVTSRAPLKVHDEQTYRLGALDVPPAGVAARQAVDHGAVALFVARARATSRHFELTDKNVSLVVEICRKLDGIPLAIELAAARAPLLGLTALAQMLDQRFRLLIAGDHTAPERQQTMLATFAWSHDLLSGEERSVFRRLGVFAGGFTLDAARAVAADEMLDEWAVVEALAGLVDKSLVVADGSDSPRFSLLETGRAYALAKLAESAEMSAIERRHAAYFRQFFDHAYDEWNTRLDVEWRAKTDSELDNLRAALNWALGPNGDPVTAIALAGASVPVWLVRDFDDHSEGRRYVRSAIIRLDATIDAGIRGRLWFALGLLLSWSDDRECLTAFERAVAIYRQTGDRELWEPLIQLGATLTRVGDIETAEKVLGEAQGLLDRGAAPRLLGLHSFALGSQRYMAGRWSESQSLFSRALAYFEESGAELLALYAMNSLANATWALGDLESAVIAFREAIDRARNTPLANKRALGVPLGNLAAVLTEQGQLPEALVVAKEALPLLRDVERAWTYYDGFALRLALVGKHENAARLEGFASAAFEASSRARRPNETRFRDRLLTLLRERFGPDDLRRLFAEGARLTDEAAYGIAL